MTGGTLDLIRPEILKLSAYHVPDSSGLIKLDAMENPYNWPETLRRDWAELLAATDVNRYPDPRAQMLQAAIREAFDIPQDQALLLGNGSDELIQMLALTLAKPGAKVLSVDPGFVMYRMIGLFANMEYVGVPLNADDFSLDLPAMLEAIERERPALTFLAYPNNPTGNLFDAEAMHRIIDASPGLVVVDEAYAPFTDQSFLGELGRWQNLLVMRTVSKMGLAGLRLGFLVGPGNLIGEIDKTRLPYNVNVLTQVSAAFALQRKAVLDEQTQAICAERERVDEVLSGIDGLQAFPSSANFILVRAPQGRAAELFELIKARGVLIKLLHGAHPLLEDCLRITVGTPDENQAFLDALRASL